MHDIQQASWVVGWALWSNGLSNWAQITLKGTNFPLRNLLVATAVVMLGMVGLMMIGWAAIAALLGECISLGVVSTRPRFGPSLCPVGTQCPAGDQF
jgi:hypothetical protein